MINIKFKSIPTNSGPVTISDGKHKPIPLRKPDGTSLYAGDLRVGPVYEIDIESGKVRWPPRNRKARRKTK
jgi:hypothetical protein